MLRCGLENVTGNEGLNLENSDERTNQEVPDIPGDRSRHNLVDRICESDLAKIDYALALGALGFHVFPLEERGKRPTIQRWQLRASNDAVVIKQMWTCPVLGDDFGFLDYNIGVLTTGWSEHNFCFVLDIDVKADKPGSQSLALLQKENTDLPPTFEVWTPTGGRHLYFSIDTQVFNTAEKLIAGIDTRGAEGYVVGPGSVTELGEYKRVR